MIGKERVTVVGKGAGADKRLYKIIEETSKYLPDGWRVEIYSGYRKGDRRFHGKKMAIDIALYDPKGNRLENYQTPETFKTYEVFAKKAREVQQKLYPELNKKFAWGGYFSGTLGKTYGAMDLMHFDIGGTRGKAGSFDKGLLKNAVKQWGVTAPSALEMLRD